MNPESDLATHGVLIEPTEYVLRLKLGYRRRNYYQVDPEPLQRRLDRVSKYLAARLQRKHKHLAVTRPRWSIDMQPMGLTSTASLYFTWADVTGKLPEAVPLDTPYMLVVPDETREITIPVNRAMRRAAR